MKGNLLKLLGVLAIVAIIVSFILMMLGMIGAVNLGNGCFLRYDSNGKTDFDSVTNTIKLNATANYKSVSNNLPDGTIEITPDPKSYGKWVNSGLLVEDNKKIKFQIEGEISLCKAYLPKNNLQFTESNRPGKSDQNDKNERIVIPRVNDVNTPPISLIIDAQSDEWRNIAELYNNDQIRVSISPNYQKDFSGTAGMQDAFIGSLATADCSEGKTKYSPICGRYSIYGGEYVNDCELRANYWKCNRHKTCTCEFLGGSGFACAMCWLHNSKCCKDYWCDDCSAWINKTTTAPQPYDSTSSYIFPWSNDVNKLFFDFGAYECSNNSTILPNGQCPDAVTDRSTKDLEYIKGRCMLNGSQIPWIGSVCLGTVEDPQLKKDMKFWYVADFANKGPTGLLYRVNGNGAPDKSLGTITVDSFAKYIPDTDQPAEYANQYKVIYNIPADVDKSYLQYRLWSKPGQPANQNTGGYVLNIKQTKCFRKNGNSFSDVFADRGKVQYAIVPTSQTPNDAGASYSPQNIDVTDADGNAEITANGKGYIWLKILNADADYAESEGTYMVKFFSSDKVGGFTALIMTPLLEVLRDKVHSASQNIFKNMVCYGGNTGSCTNFFTYIKAMLILYVMSYGAMFLLGMVKISQQDLVIRIAKIAIVSGLMNGSTFEFFNNYLFGAITGFSDEIIANMSGYSLFTSTSTITNPFMFLDAVMSKILFSKTFMAQLLALLSMGLSGLIYFVIVFIATVIVVITALRAVAVYIMAFMAIALLIGIAPFFLTFLLFDFTRYLFDNWVRFTFRYMIEPVVLMAGIIVLTQLFTIYLDFVTGYSVCWKCAVPIQIPFIGTILPIALLDVPIFCINWFAPWGMDYRSGMMGINMQHMIALVIIAYGMYGYVEFSGRMVVKLTSTMGPSATNMGMGMANAAETGALKRIGMDKKSRAQITKNAEGRLMRRQKTLERVEKRQGASALDKPSSPESK